MKFSQLLASLALALTAPLAACSDSEGTGIEDVSCPPGSTLTYANFGQQFVMDNCIGCHTQQSPRLATQAQVQAASASILDQAVYTAAMPPNRDIARAERELLGEWLACGAP